MRYGDLMTLLPRGWFVSVLVCVLSWILVISQSHTQLPPSPSSAPRARKAEIDAAVAMICTPSDIMRSKNGAVTRCQKCPEGTDFRGDNMDKWNLVGSAIGHFTSAHDENLILDGAGCDSHASNWGGSYIFSIISDAPQLLKYDKGLHINRCREFYHPDGREFLVCQDNNSGQGEEDSTVFLAQFDAAGNAIQTNILSAEDTKGTCGDDPSTKVEVSGIRDIRYVIKESGQLKEMTVTATKGEITCAQANRLKPGRQPLAVKIYQIEFTFDGNQFTPSPASLVAYNLFPRFQ